MNQMDILVNFIATMAYSTQVAFRLVKDKPLTDRELVVELKRRFRLYER